MATVASLADDVYVLTNRPDLVSETQLAIRKAIFKFHSADTFKRDLTVQRLQMDSYPPISPDHWQWNIALSAFTRFRRPKFLRYPTDLAIPQRIPAPLIDWPVGAAWTGGFTEVTADNIFDRYSTQLANYFFVAGSNLTIRASYPYDYLDFGYYQYPEISPSPTPISSWICDQYPDAIVEEAAGTVFKMIGKDDEYNRYQTLFAENIAILRGTDVGEGV